MDYLFASASIDPRNDVFREISGAMSNEDRIATYRDVEDLSARLHRHNRPGIMIFLVANQQDLAGVSGNREVILEADVILLVPDGEEETFAVAHALRPSYLGRIDSDLDKVVPVLKRLLEKRARLPASTDGSLR